MNDLFCIGAFEQKLNEFIGSPEMIGLVFAKDLASLPATVSKQFDMDCETYNGQEMLDSLGKLFAVPASPSCFVRLYFGSNEDQLGEVGPVLTLVPVVTFAVDFDKAAVEEYLKTGALSSRDPPVIEGPTRAFVWAHDKGTWAWTKKKWEPSGVGIYLDGDDTQLSCFGEGIPLDAFDTPEFSDMTPNY